MHGLTGGDWKRNVPTMVTAKAAAGKPRQERLDLQSDTRHRASPRPSSVVILRRGGPGRRTATA